MRSRLVKLGVVGSSVSCEESLLSGFIFALWTRAEMNEAPEVEYLETFLKKINIESEELTNLEDNQQRLDLITDTLSKQKKEFSLWFKVGLWTYSYTWLLGHDYYATETEEARYLIRENPDIRKAGACLCTNLLNLNWSPDKVESFNLDKLIPFLWENDLRKWAGNSNMAVMSDLKHEARILDLKAAEDNTESRVKSALRELISGIPIVGKAIGILIFGNKK